MTSVDLTRRKEIAMRLKEARDIAGLTQAQAAKALSVHRPTIAEIEAGRRKVSAEELSSFANLYRVSSDWLIDVEDAKTSEIGDGVLLAARNLENINPDDLDKLIHVLKAIRGRKVR